MSDPKSAIALIASSADPKTFGTGFVVHQDEACSYLVTCAHVLRDIEKQNGAQIIAGGLAARVVARGEPDEVDLAIVAVPRWWDRSPLILATGTTGTAVCVWGHCSREEKSALLREEQRGQLAKAAQLTGRRSGEAVAAWYLSFGGGDRLEPGYSGGPVLCGDRVVAVAAIKLGDDRAIAIGVEALAAIWPEMPPGLIEAVGAGSPRPDDGDADGRPAGRLIGREALPAVPVWAGRDRLVAELGPLVRAGEALRVVALIGQGGIGKSALAVKLLEAAGVNPASGQLLPEFAARGFGRAIAFKAFEGTSFDEVAAHLLSGLDAAEGRSPMQPAAKVAAIVRALAEEPALVVLDNLESVLHPARHPQAGRAIEPEWGELLAALANGNHRSLVLLTSREEPADLAGTRFVAAKPNRRLVRLAVVDAVDVAGAIAILRENGMEDSEADLRWIAERVQGHPFVLELLARNYADRPGYLRRHPALLTGELDVDQLIRSQLARQSSAAQDLLQRMALLRVAIDARGLTYLRLYTDDWEQDERFELAAELEEPAEFTAAEIAETQELLRQLTRASLVQRRYDPEACEEFFDLHRVVVEFLQRELGEAKGALLQSVYRFYCTGKALNNPKTIDDLQPLLEAQYFAFQLGNYSEAKNLIYQLETYLQPWGYWTLLKDLCEQVLPHLDRASQPYILSRIGSRYRDWGSWDEAERYYRQALDIAEAVEDHSLTASLTILLGVIEWSRGNWNAAERLYRQSLKMFTKLGDLASTTNSRALLGDIERMRGNWDAAERLYRQCLEVQVELGNRKRMADIWKVLSTIEWSRENWDAAEHLCRQCLEVKTELSDLAGMAESWGFLGDIEQKRGNWDAAERLYRQCLEVETELCNLAGTAAVIGCLGKNELGRGNLEGAEPLFHDALHRVESLGKKDQIAEINFDLALLEKKRGNLSAAEQHFHKAREIYQQLGATKDLERIETEWHQAP